MEAIETSSLHKRMGYGNILKVSMKQVKQITNNSVSKQVRLYGGRSSSAPLMVKMSKILIVAMMMMVITQRTVRQQERALPLLR